MTGVVIQVLKMADLLIIEAVMSKSPSDRRVYFLAVRSQADHLLGLCGVLYVRSALRHLVRRPSGVDRFGNTDRKY